MKTKARYMVYTPVDPDWDFAGLYDMVDNSIVYYWDTDKNSMFNFKLIRAIGDERNNSRIKPNKRFYYTPIPFNTIEEFRCWFVQEHLEYLL